LCPQARGETTVAAAAADDEEDEEDDEDDEDATVEGAGAPAMALMQASTVLATCATRMRVI
jgi:hypothetical protein